MRIPVEIIGNHPHAGTRGYIKSDGKTVKTIIMPWDGKRMFEVTLENSPLMVDACFAERKDFKFLSTIKDTP